MYLCICILLLAVSMSGWAESVTCVKERRVVKHYYTCMYIHTNIHMYIHCVYVRTYVVCHCESCTCFRTPTVSSWIGKRTKTSRMHAGWNWTAKMEVAMVSRWTWKTMQCDFLPQVTPNLRESTQLHAACSCKDAKVSCNRQIHCMCTCMHAH